MNNKYKNPKQLRAYVALAWYAFKAQIRNPATFAFGFLFPVVFISIFGLIGSGNQQMTIGLPTDTNMNNSIVQVLQKQQFVILDKEDTSSLENKLKSGKLASIIRINNKETNHYTIQITTSSANPQATAAVTSLMRGIVDQLNLQLAHVTNPAITLSQNEISGRAFRYIDFALPGQIGFSLLSTAIFGTVFGLIFLKKSLVLKRMFATPTRALTMLLAQGTSRLIIALLQTLLILLIGIVVFKFYLPHGFATFVALLIISTIGLISFLGFGYFFAGIANDENSAGPLVNLVTLPQFLLSGTFFPTDNLPIWLQPIANNLPLSYFNTAVRNITTEGQSITTTWPYLLGLLAWGIVMYLLAAKTFRWQ